MGNVDLNQTVAIGDLVKSLDPKLAKTLLAQLESNHRTEVEVSKQDLDAARRVITQYRVKRGDFMKYMRVIRKFLAEDDSVNEQFIAYVDKLANPKTRTNRKQRERRAA